MTGYDSTKVGGASHCNLAKDGIYCSAAVTRCLRISGQVDRKYMATQNPTHLQCFDVDFVETATSKRHR